MNRSILKNLACESRDELIERIQIRALQYGIQKDNIEDSSDCIIVNGTVLGKEEKLQRKKLIEKIKSLNDNGENGYDRVIEETAYIWFNRFVALRFMEVNDYLPTGVRALSSSLPGNIEPDLIRDAFEVELPVDTEKIYHMKSNNDMEGLFKYMIIAQCNSLNKTLPFMFEKLGNSTELLFPGGILNEGAFIRRLTDTNLISENQWKDVTIIGWLYEYYISEKKNKVMKAKKKYAKEEIPYVTQLFTPDWIVRYMVENSLGRYWVESHPEHSDLKKNWKFYIESPHTVPEEKLIPYVNRKLRVEDIKCFDPACGSGHILIYMFDVLYQIYEKCGYMQREIPELIIKNNLYGMDIDDRAYQLACFAVVMQGMKYNKKLLRSAEGKSRNSGTKSIDLHIVSIQESNSFNEYDIIYIAGERLGENYSKTKSFIEKFRNAKIYGSLIQLGEFDESFFTNRLKYIISSPVENLTQNESRKKIIRLLPKYIKQARIMSETYDILVTNPPYMGNKYFNPLLGKYIAENYSRAKADIFSAFIVYSFSKVKYNGHLAFMVPFVWMFIQSYEKLREIIIHHKNISSLIQLQYSGFEEATVPICTFTLRNYNVDIRGDYIKLSSFKGAGNQGVKTIEAIANPCVNYRFTVNQRKMENIPGKRFGYWLTDREIEILNRAKVMADVSFPCTGMQTGNNDEYIRQWFEVEYDLISFPGENNREKYWIPYQMGGEARKWYGNVSEIIYWKDNGQKVKREKGSVIRNEKFFFHRGISWKRITSGRNTIRVLNEGFIFDQSADSIFVKNEADYNYILSFFNTKVMMNIFEFISPTLNLTAGTVKQIPIYVEHNILLRKKIDFLCEECIRISKNYWDSFETSWDFKRHPLLVHKKGSNSIEEAYDNWRDFSEKQFCRLKEAEEELNKIFIQIYGFQNEMTAEIEERDITISRANRQRDIKSFISYAVGCMFGRYSLDTEGIVYAGGKWSDRWQIVNDNWKVRKTKVDAKGNVISDNWVNSTFAPVQDNIIPIFDEGYFQNDIVSRFIKFVGITFGDKNLSRNLNFIAQTLGKNKGESDKDTIERYFLKDFFKDHVQMYKKRPIYWLITSGKQKTFNCLIYMHRYNEDILSKIRMDYLQDLQEKLDRKEKFLVHIIGESCDTYERSYAKKKLSDLYKAVDELKQYDEILHHMADMKVKIHLDDGVKANYEKLKALLK
ncbi:BREX-1 system adenine-specific DNA-methyltransferase PglX [Clostridium sp. JNZ X4-2]